MSESTADEEPQSKNDTGPSEGSLTLRRSGWVAAIGVVLAVIGIALAVWALLRLS